MAATATIANGTALSDAVRCPHGCLLAYVKLPAAWTVANLTFQVSLDGGATFQDLYRDAGEFVSTVGALTASGVVVVFDRHHPVVGVVKVRSGTAGTPVNQGAERALTLYFEPVK